MKKLSLVLALLLWLPSGAEARSLNGRYFMVVFGYQTIPNRAVDSHTFAAFYEGRDLEWGGGRAPATISWLPATGIVRPLGRERGRNFSLDETLAIARSRGYEVRAWGPYEITPSLYRAALGRIRVLESGRLLYKMIDGPFSPRAVNCISAVSDIAGPLHTGTDWGFAASGRVAAHFAPWVMGFPRVDGAVADLIGINAMVGRF